MPFRLQAAVRIAAVLGSLWPVILEHRVMDRMPHPESVILYFYSDGRIEMHI